MMAAAMSLLPGSLAASLLAVAALVLAVAGAAKVVRPAPTAVALRASGLSWIGHRGLVVFVRALALAELVVAGDALVDASAWARVVLAASYVTFAGFVLYALVRRLPIASCGCFGEADTPPTAAHLIVNIGLAAATIVAAVTRAPAPSSVLTHRPGAGSLVALGVLVSTALCLLVLTTLARVTAEGRAAAAAVFGPGASRRSG